MKLKVNFLSLILGVGLALNLGSCSKKNDDDDKGSVTLAAHKLTLATSVSLQNSSLSAQLTTDGDPATANVSFTPDSVLLPIRTILISPDGPGPTARASVSIHEGQPGGTVYSCSDATQDGCYIDIADPTALAKLTSTVDLTVGHVLTVSVNVCSGTDTSAKVKIKGSFSKGGQTYSTASGADPLSTDGTLADYVSVSVGCAISYVIPNGGFDITKGADETVTLEFTNAFLETGTPVGNQAALGGCVGGANSNVCSAYPDIVPFIGTTVPTASSYLVTNIATGARALIDIVLDNDGTAVGGFARSYQDGTNLPLEGVQGPMKTFSKNADGTYAFAFYPDGNNASFANFSLNSGAGTFAAGNGSSVAYTAVKQ